MLRTSTDDVTDCSYEADLSCYQLGYGGYGHFMQGQ